ncbi:MAG: hypothetical protein ACXVUE_17460 [Solirubrobacteraceae bacterium]
MKVVVTGATGNVGTSVVRALSADASVTQIVAIARDEAVTRRVNVDGSRRIFEAVVAAGVPALV